VYVIEQTMSRVVLINLI